MRGYARVARSAVLVGVLGAFVVVGHAGSASVAGDPGCLPQWWPEPRQNACGNGSATNAQAPSPANVAGLVSAWKYEPGLKGIPAPVVWKGAKMQAPLVYVEGGGHMKALDLATGRARWTAKAEAGTHNGAQPVADGDVLLQSNGNVLRRYVPRSGHIVWQRTMGRVDIDDLSPLVVAGGNLYSSAGGMLVAYNELTGKRVWTRDFRCFHCGLAASGGRLYASGSPDNPDEGPGALYALDARTGKTVWSARTPAADYTSASPVLAGGRVFVRTLSRVSGSWMTSIEAFGAADGRHLWHASMRPSTMFWFMPVSADARVIVYASEHGYLYAFDASSGALRWEVPDITNTLRPAIVNGLVWAEDVDGRLLALDARDGRQLWASQQFGLDQLGSPVVAGSFVLVGVKDGPLIAYHVP